MDLSNLGNMSALAVSGNAGVVVSEIPLEQIVAKEQVRSESNQGFQDESLNQLASSIKDYGLQEPIIVRASPNEANKYLIICGERRYRASKLAGLATIPAIVKEINDEKTVMIIQITENIQREGISSIEFSRAVKKLADLGMTNAEIAQSLQKAPSQISESLKMLTMPNFMMNLYASGVLSQSPRTICDYISLSKKYGVNELEEAINRYMQDFKDASDKDRDNNEAILDRPACRKIKHYLEFTTVKADEIPGLDDPEEIKADYAERPVEENASDDADFEGSDEEYTESAEREHSESPKMFSANQENSSPTAKVGGSSDYTDKDTRVAHDLSESVHEDTYAESGTYEKGGEDIAADESDTDGQSQIFRAFKVVFGIEECELTFIKGCDDEHVMLKKADGSLIEAPMNEVQLNYGV